MAIDFNHTIVSARDSKASAEFLAQMLGLPAPRKWGPFQMVTTANGANIDFKNTEGEITAQHYAFLVSEPEFDQIFGRIRKRSLPYWADPAQEQPQPERDFITNAVVQGSLADQPTLPLFAAAPARGRPWSAPWSCLLTTAE